VSGGGPGFVCPIDGAALVMSERQGIEIDYCPTCRGVWLDRGELDKIIAKSMADDEPSQAAPRPAPPRGEQQWRPDRDPNYRGKRRKSFFEDLFD
jgi:Zn-finger nucleic acid-binding protein